MAVELINPKQIADPDNEGQMINNPDFDPTKNEDGTPLKAPVDPKDDLAPIKESLNKAYGERDALKAERDALLKEKRDAELQALKDQGKDKEHFEAVLSDKETEIAGLKKQVIELTRDNAVQKALGSYNFKNDKAATLATSSVIAELVQDADGKWVHKSGKSIEDFVKVFAEDEDNVFLFKQKENRGTGTTPANPAPPTTKGKRLADMSQAEVIKLAEEGKLPRRK